MRRSTRTSRVVHAQRADRRGQRAAVGHHRRAEGGRAGRRGGRWSPSRRSSTSWTPVPGAVVLPTGCSTRSRSCPGGAAPVLRAGLLRPRQRRLPGLGRDQPRPRRVPPWLGELREDGRSDWTADEMMSVAAARALRDGQACFVGIGLPSTAANLARRLHAPEPGADLRVRHPRHPARRAAAVHRRRHPGRRPRSPWSACRRSSTTGCSRAGSTSASSPAPRSTASATSTRRSSASYDEPAVRLPGSGGAPEIAASCREVIVVMRHRARAFVEQVDFVTSVGHGTRPRRPRAARPARGRPDPRDHRPRGARARPGDRRAGAHRGAPGRHRRAGAGARPAGSCRSPADLTVTAAPTHRGAGRAARDAHGRRPVSAPVKLHHVDDGPGDAPVLVLAGSLGSTLDDVAPAARAAEPSAFRLIRIDHRGHGGSPVPPGPYRMADLAGDVVALLDELELAAGGLVRAVAGRHGRHVPGSRAPGADQPA